MTDVCGWLIKKRDGSGRTTECVMNPEHKDQHRDAKYVESRPEYKREYMRGYYQDNTESIAEKHREYNQVNAEKIAEKKREYQQANAEKIAERIRTRNFGVPAGWYEQQLERQEFKCAICPRTEAGGQGRFHVDHDHICCPGKKSCGKCVRGLLCHWCNTSLGGFQDNPNVLRAAISYLAMYAV